MHYCSIYKLLHADARNLQGNLRNKDTTGTAVNWPVQWNLHSKDTIGTTVNWPVQWNLRNKDTTGTTVNWPVQWNLHSKDTIETTINCPIYGGVLIFRWMYVRYFICNIQSNGVLFKEVSVFRRCPLTGFPSSSTSHMNPHTSAVLRGVCHIR